MTPHIFFINLDRSIERRGLMQRQAATVGVDIERVQGALGTAIEGSIKSQFLNADGSIASGLGAGEVGCYASHLMAYKAVVERDLPMAVVLEDDVELPARLAGTLSEVAARLPPQWDIIKLCNHPKRPVYVLDAISATHSLVRFYRQPPLAGAYLISNAGAQKMLTRRRRVRPIDMEMRQPWHIGLDMYGVCPPPIRQRRDLDSEINRIAPRSRGGPLYRNPCRTFAYAVRKIGLLPTIACRIVEGTALIGLSSIGAARVMRPSIAWPTAAEMHAQLPAVTSARLSPTDTPIHG